MRGDDFYLTHIAERIGRIEAYTSEGKEGFLSSTLTQDAVIRSFEVIGEAVKQLSPAVREQAPDVPWRSIAGFRDVLIHNYIGVDVALVWETVEVQVPVLKRAVQRLRDGTAP